MSANKFYKSSKPTKRTKQTATAPGIPELFVGGLPSHVTGADLHVFFGCYGRVADVRMMNYRDGMSRGFAFVRFQAIESAQKVILMSPLSYAGKARYLFLISDFCWYQRLYNPNNIQLQICHIMV